MVLFLSLIDLFTLQLLNNSRGEGAWKMWGDVPPKKIQGHKKRYLLLRRESRGGVRPWKHHKPPLAENISSQLLSTLTNEHTPQIILGTKVIKINVTIPSD